MTRLADVLANRSATTIGVLTTTQAWEEYASAILPDLLEIAENVHRSTSGSGGCALGSCDSDDHASTWHKRFTAKLAEALA